MHPCTCARVHMHRLAADKSVSRRALFGLHVKLLLKPGMYAAARHVWNIALKQVAGFFFRKPYTSRSLLQKEACRFRESTLPWALGGIGMESGTS